MEVLKRTKKSNFSKGLVHGFCPKSKFLLSLFFAEIMSEKIVFRYFGKETIIFKTKNWSSNKSQKIDIFQRGLSMDFVQKSNLLLWVFFTEIISENIVFDIVEKKWMILSGKYWSFNKNQKMDIFYRG